MKKILVIKEFDEIGNLISEKEYKNFVAITDDGMVSDSIDKFEALSYYEKLPLGIMPQWRWLELRKEDLQNAIGRYMNSGKVVPEEWLEEYNLLIKVSQEE